MRIASDRLYVWGFVSLLTVMSLLLLLLPKQSFSEGENRKLQTAPVFSWERLWSKAFSSDAESYISDHFPLRSEWVASKSLLERLRLQQENNGILFGRDQYLFEAFEEPDPEQLALLLDALNQFAANHPEARVSFMLAPNSVGLYPERLPWMAPVYPQREVHDNIKKQLTANIGFLDGFDFLEPVKSEADRPLYYHTDHHWTTYGAYEAYKAYAVHAGWQPLSVDEFHVRSVSDSFLGSYHTRSQYSGIQPDQLVVFEPKEHVPTSVAIVDTGETKNSLYDPAFLVRKDKYSYFQGGVHALLQATTETAVDADKLLIIKDSFAHSVLPFLTGHVRDIHMIDIRFYNGNISDYMEQHGISDVLLLFNTSTFVTERGLLKLKY